MEATNTQNELVAMIRGTMAFERYIKSSGLENKENNEAALRLWTKVNELWLEYLETGEK